MANSYGIILNVKTAAANADLITALISAMPDAGAEGVHTSYHNIPTSFVVNGGTIGMASRADFNLEASRDSVRTVLKAISGVPEDFVGESWIRFYDTVNGADTVVEEITECQ